MKNLFGEFWLKKTAICSIIKGSRGVLELKEMKKIYIQILLRKSRKTENLLKFVKMYNNCNILNQNHYKTHKP